MISVTTLGMRRRPRIIDRGSVAIKPLVISSSPLFTWRCWTIFAVGFFYRVYLDSMASPGVTSDVESPLSPRQSAGVTAEAYFEQSVAEISFDLDHPDHAFPGTRYRFADGSEPTRVGCLFKRQRVPTAASNTGQFWIPQMAFAVLVHAIAEECIEYAMFNSDPVTTGQTALVSVPSYIRYFLCGICTAGFLLGVGWQQLPSSVTCCNWIRVANRRTNCG